MDETARARELLKVSEDLHRTSASLVPQVVQVAGLIADAYRRGGKVVLFGNGGSAADAQHIAGELVGRFRFERPSLPAVALSTNTSSLTAIANDFSYDAVFERAVEGIVQAGDVVIGLSTSGESRNVLRGIEAAKRKGAKTVAFCGSKGRLAALCDVALAVPSTDTPRIQEVHITLGHIVCELVEEELFGAAGGKASRRVP